MVKFGELFAKTFPSFLYFIIGLSTSRLTIIGYQRVIGDIYLEGWRYSNPFLWSTRFPISNGLEITFNASDRMPVVIERPTGCRGESRKPEARRKCQDIDEFIFPSSFTNPLSHSFVISLTSSSCLSSLGESNPPKFPFFQSDPFLHRIVNNLYLRLRILIPSPLPSKRGRGRVSKRKKKRRRKKERLGGPEAFVAK